LNRSRAARNGWVRLYHTNGSPPSLLPNTTPIIFWIPHYSRKWHVWFRRTRWLLRSRPIVFYKILLLPFWGKPSARESQISRSFSVIIETMSKLFCKVSANCTTQDYNRILRVSIRPSSIRLAAVPQWSHLLLGRLAEI